MPKVSIILTSYNHEKYLREAIDSVLAQTYPDFELIIWDDASSDSSWSIIKSYSDTRIRAFRNEKNRLSHYGVNKTISEIASGEYIAMHHSDDAWAPEKLQKQVQFLDGHPQCGAVFTRALAIGEDSQPLDDPKHFYSRIFDQPNRSRHEWLRHFFFRGNALCHPSVLIRKRCFEECGLYSESLAQLPDFDMWVRLCFRYGIHVLEDQLTRFRVRAAEMNSSGNRPDVRIRDRSEFHYVLRQYFRISNFEELASIFPEAKQYYRADGCEPKFVMAMVALDRNSFQWAKFLAIETLFDLLADPEIRGTLQSLYQFGCRDFFALSGKYDLFSLETVVNQGNEIARRDAIIAQQAEQIAQLTRSAHSTSQVVRHVSSHASTSRAELPADREDYEKAAHQLESGNVKQGRESLETLAANDSTCWDVYNDLAVLYFNEGDFARAASSFEKGMALEGGSGTTARNFASMQLAAGDVEGALATWGSILHELPYDEAVLTIIRDVLANLNPIPPNAWERLILDLRTGAKAELVKQDIHGSIESTARREAVAPAKEIRIFQIYYDEKTKLQLDPDFIPLDNSENSRPDWCEYWPIRKVLGNQSFDDDTYLGFFSPRFFDKTGMRGSKVLEIVRGSDDDVISFSPYFDQCALHLNPFYQGEANHPGLLAVAQNVSLFLDVDLDLKSIICDQTTSIFSNYFVARYSFWKKWFAYVEKVIEMCEGPDNDLKSSLVSTTPYRKGAEYEMKLFICERLVTIVMEQLGIRSKVGIDIGKAPLILPGSKENLVGLLICDALKGQYRKTGQSAYMDAFFKIRGGTFA